MDEREKYVIAFFRAKSLYDSFGDVRELIRQGVLERIGDKKENYSLADKVTGQILSGQNLPDGVTEDNLRQAVKFLEGFRRKDSS